MFLEDRTDLRAEIGAGGRRAVVHGRQHGVAVRRGLDPHASWHLSEPRPGEVERLAGAAWERHFPSANEGASRLAGSRPRDTTAPRVGSADTGSLLALLERLVAVVVRRSAKPVDARARGVTFEQRVWIGRPESAVVEDRRASGRVRLEVTLANGATAVGERVLREGDDGWIDSFAESVARRAGERAAALRAPAGETAVVFAAGTGGVFVHELVGHALEADTLLAGGSFLARLDPPVCSSEVTVLDDPRRARAPLRVDDEGESVRPTALLRGGRVAGALDDLRTARREGRPATGHGRRSSYREPVRPRMGCTFLSPGRLEPGEVIASTPRGVFVRRMEAAAIDPPSGEATFRVTDADAIDRGRIVSPLRPFLLKVKTHTALRSLDRIASDLVFDTCIGTCLRDGQPVATSVGAPTFRTGVATVLS